MRYLIMSLFIATLSSCATGSYSQEENDAWARAFAGMGRAGQQMQQQAPQNRQQNCYYTPNGTGGYLVNCQ